MNNRELTSVFAAVGRRNGYDDVQCEFVPFRDFKVRWTRSYKWISFEVSDYLSDAPDDVMADIAMTIFQRIKGDKSPYSDRVRDWLSSRDFVRSKQPLFVERYRGLSLSPQGRERNIRDSYDRLVCMGLVDDDDDVYLGWAPNERGRWVGRVSVLMKVVMMSELLDCAEVPDAVFDYCVYAQLAHVSLGFDARNVRRGEEYDELLSRFPGRSTAEGELRRLGMHI